MERKELNKKEMTEVLKKTALNTSKEHEVSINKPATALFQEHTFVSYLKAILPSNYGLSSAINTTGRGFTIKVKNQYGEQIHRIFIPSSTFKRGKYSECEFGFSDKEAREAAVYLGIPDNRICQVSQHDGKYFFCDDMGILKAYLDAKYINKK